jgi:hypothetical protein
MPRSIAGMMSAASTTRAKLRAGFVSRHDIEVLPQNPVQSLDSPNHLEEAELMQWSASGAAAHERTTRVRAF